MSVLWVFVLWLHLLATVAWIGGMIFYVLVLVPSMGAIDPPQRGKLVGAVLKRYSPLAWGAIIVLIITGIFIAVYKGFGGVSFSSNYGIILFAKHLVILIMIVIGALVSFVIGPKLKAPPAPAEVASGGPPGPPPGMVKLQKQAGALGLINLVLGIAVLFLTELLKSF